MRQVVKLRDISAREERSPAEGRDQAETGWLLFNRPEVELLP